MVPSKPLQAFLDEVLDRDDNATLGDALDVWQEMEDDEFEKVTGLNIDRHIDEIDQLYQELNQLVEQHGEQAQLKDHSEVFFGRVA